jgi:hypothetical protein
MSDEADCFCGKNRMMPSRAISAHPTRGAEQDLRGRPGVPGMKPVLLLAKCETVLLARKMPIDHINIRWQHKMRSSVLS